MGTILMPGGGGGIDLDVVTAAAGDILRGKVIVGADGEPLTGTLALTGNAGTGDVLSGKTFYNDDAKTKRSGTMANRGALNWSEINTTKSVDAGYYSEGTLDSRPSYNSGRTQGQNDVKNSPNSYSLYTKAQYDANYNNGVTAGKNSVKVISGSYYANSDETVNYNGQNRSRKVVIINPGGTPIAAFARNGSTNDWVVRFDNGIFMVSDYFPVSSSHAWSSNSIHLPTSINSAQTWNYWVVVK